MKNCGLSLYPVTLLYVYEELNVTLIGGLFG